MLPIGGKGNAPDTFFMANEGLETSSGVEIPLFDAATIATTDEGIALGGKGNVGNDAGMTLEDFGAMSGGGVP